MTNPNHTHTGRSGDLVERMRYTAKYGIFTAIKNGRYASLDEAANRIEALKAEVEGLRGALGNLINAYTANVDTYRLGGFYTDPETEDEVIEARAALGAKP